MKINSSYLLATKAAKIEPSPDMEYHDGMFYHTGTDGLWMFPIKWWQATNGTFGDGDRYNIDNFTESAYPNGWAVLYFKKPPSAWWFSPNRNGGGWWFPAYSNPGATVAHYVFDNYADALQCVRAGNLSKVKDAHIATNTKLRAVAHEYATAYTYRYFQEDSTGNITMHPALNASTFDKCISTPASFTAMSTYPTNGTFYM